MQRGNNRKDSKVNPKRVWRRLFGRYPIGAIIVPNALFLKMYSACYIWSDNIPSPQKIPSKKFVGRIIGVASWDKRIYLVRWIADRRIQPRSRTLQWRDNLFHEL